MDTLKSSSLDIQLVAICRQLVEDPYNKSLALKWQRLYQMVHGPLPFLDLNRHHSYWQQTHTLGTSGFWDINLDTCQFEAEWLAVKVSPPTKIRIYLSDLGEGIGQAQIDSVDIWQWFSFKHDYGYRPFLNLRVNFEPKAPLKEIQIKIALGMRTIRDGSDLICI